MQTPGKAFRHLLGILGLLIALFGFSSQVLWATQRTAVEDPTLKLRLLGYTGKEIEEILASPQGWSRVQSRYRLRALGFSEQEALVLVPPDKERLSRKRTLRRLPHPELVARALKPYRTIIARASRRNALPRSLLEALIICESGGDERALSVKGAMGLMQLMPGTARDLGVTKPFDPEQCIEGGSRYLGALRDRFHPRWDLVLAAYNAGPETVSLVNRVPDIPETRAYVTRVLGLARLLETTEKR